MRTGNTRRPRARAPRPRDRSAVRLCRIGGCEDERFRVLAFTRAQLSQPFDRTREGELRAAESLHEVTATADTECLERAQLSVHRTVTARNPFSAHAVTGDDALPFEQQLRKR